MSHYIAQIHNIPSPFNFIVILKNKYFLIWQKNDGNGNNDIGNAVTDGSPITSTGTKSYFVVKTIASNGGATCSWQAA